MAQTARPYHHGDLQTALVEAGLRLARTGGADAVGVRDVTREAGVSPAAAYRHFDDRRALVTAVALAAQARMATTIRARIGALKADAVGDRERALAALRGVGQGYIEFALDEPGWFELALLTFDDGDEPMATSGADVPAPFQLLIDALDACAASGVLTDAQRQYAEWPCWSAVHGFADLATRGPLQCNPRGDLEALGTGVVDSAIAGLRQRAASATVA